jgi:hypothetical protein
MHVDKYKQGKSGSAPFNNTLMKMDAEGSASRGLRLVEERWSFRTQVERAADGASFLGEALRKVVELRCAYPLSRRSCQLKDHAAEVCSEGIIFARSANRLVDPLSNAALRAAAGLGDRTRGDHANHYII